MTNRISWHWNQPLTGVGCLVSTAIAVGGAFSAGNGWLTTAGLLFAAGFGYYGLACFANSTVIERVGGHIFVRNDPLPTGPPRRYPVGDVMRVRTAQVLAPEHADETWFAPASLHQVTATPRDGRTVVLASVPEDEAGSRMVAKKVAAMCGLSKR